MFFRRRMSLSVPQYADSETADLVVYYPLSGDTHLLNVVDASALKCVPADSAVELDSLVQRVANELDVAADDQLRDYLQRLVLQFDELGLIEPVSKFMP